MKTTKKTAAASRAKAKKLLELILDKHPEDPLVLDLRGLDLIWDFFVIVSSTSGPHARAILEELLEGSKRQGLSIHHSEKDELDQWFLIDYGDVCFHIFSQEKRVFYSLERLFKGAKKVRFRFK